ncbi:MAG: family 1 glycosylhydrolase, partial [Chloroflexota bacterium]|nr:family 1 glycosylhydrolase [Chloroflexota bacterium]
MTSLTFPPGFLWGAATAALHVEGALDADGRGPSIWDRFMRQPGKIADGSLGDIANDHYHRWPEDIAIMRALGLQAYRFSVAWPRIIPDGHGPVNEAGLAFYDRLVDALLEAGIEPVLTLYHWDLPAPLEDRGGWPHRDTVEHFTRYADVVARRLGDRVRMWVTHNEPWVMAFPGYGLGRMAPGRTDWRATVGAAHHLLLSHATAAEAIHRACPDASVGILLNLSPSYPWTSSEADAAAAWRFDGFLNRWFLDPLLRGAYPEDMLEFYGADRPPIMPGDMERIAAATDWLGVNYYLRTNVHDDPGNGKLQFRVPGPRPGAERNEIGW